MLSSKKYQQYHHKQHKEYNMTNTNTNTTIPTNFIDTLENKKDELIELTRYFVNALIYTYVPFTDELTKTDVVNVGKFESLFNDVYKNYMAINEKVKQIHYIVENEPSLREHAEVTHILELVNKYEKVAYGVYSDLVALAVLIMSEKTIGKKVTDKCLEIRHVVDCFIVMKDMASC